MLTLLFRRPSPTGFSIEKLFNGLYQHFLQNGVAVDRMEMPRTSCGLYSVLVNAWSVRQRANRRVLHITGDVHYGALLTPMTKTVITIHDCVILQRGKGIKKFIFWLLWYRLPLSFANAITVISEQTKRELLSVVRLPPHKVHYIPNYVSPQFRFSDRTFNTTLPRILHVGTRSNKNLPRVIHALQGLQVMLVIVGVLEDDQKTLLGQVGIRFENHATPAEPELISLYETADLISFPSTYEGFGMPIIEGHAVGRPVLTSDMEPMRSVAGPGGAVLVDPLSVASIRDGFVRLLQDPALREALVTAGRQNCSRYQLDVIADKYMALYRSLHG